MRDLYGSIDVVIPCFHSSATIESTVDSCLRQTYPINRIFLIDDGSSFDEVSFLHKHFGSNPNITIVESRRYGHPGIMRRIGIQQSSADWIAFLDSDDEWLPSKLGRQLTFVNKSNYQAAYTNATTIHPNGNETSYHDFMPKKVSFRDLVKCNWLINSSVIIRTDLLKRDFNYADSHRLAGVEDYATWLRISTRIEFHGIDEHLIRYRISDASIRRLDNYDPRMHALVDFLMWSKSSNTKVDLSHHRELVLQEISKIAEVAPASIRALAMVQSKLRSILKLN